jgi:hypothetical protein
MTEVKEKSGGKKCLLRQVYCGHGFLHENMQFLFTSNYDQQAQSHGFVEVESIVRKYSIENENIYSLAEFACCRNPFNPRISLEESKNGQKDQSLVNLTFLHGAGPTEEVKGNTMFVKDISRLLKSEADIDDNFVDMPEVFYKVISSDAKFETTKNNYAQNLRIYFQN